jgi:hypothetical protein
MKKFLDCQAAEVQYRTKFEILISPIHRIILFCLVAKEHYYFIISVLTINVYHKFIYSATFNESKELNISRPVI